MTLPTPKPNDQHVYNHFDNDGARVYLKAERNSKGHNWEVSIHGAQSVEEA